MMSSYSLPGAALVRFFEPVEEPAGVRAGKRVQPMWLSLLDGVARHRSFGAQELHLAPHLVVPAVLVIFADIHEDAHLGDRLKLGLRRLPHVSGERGDREEILRIGSGDVE